MNKDFLMARKFSLIEMRHKRWQLRATHFASRAGLEHLFEEAEEAMRQLESQYQKEFEENYGVEVEILCRNLKL